MLKSHNVTFRPIEAWPGKKSSGRDPSPFRAKWSDTCNVLDRELFKLGARSVVIQLDCDGSQIRRDGMPRADARTRGPGVIISFESRKLGGNVSFPCDRFTHWQDNVRAIALALEALRKVDRYGVTRNAEQYRGWSKLGHDASAPAGDPVSRSATTIDDAAEFLRACSGGDAAVIVRSSEAYRVAYRRGAAACHPDRWGGDHSHWRKFQAAADILDKHHGV